MNCNIIKMNSMQLIGFQREFSAENSYREIPKYWSEVFSAHKEMIVKYNVGEYAVCADDVGGGKFRYIIAGKYDGGDIPDGMVVYEFPACEWAVFDCIGPIPEAFQSLNTQIFKEWLPGNPEFELSGNATIEWYSSADTMRSPDYHSAIWIPVKRK